ncbi:MAG: divalent-cation tolerance protein CutA [Alphaproteobacteria bacterium]|nr:MAG: divalent-cation tolerance protein CutA [Alphaproteobacteria bacterium]
MRAAGKIGASIYTTIADTAAAHRLARALVEERLAACVNVLGPAHSVYRWEGAVEEESEWVLIIKTRRALVQRVRERLCELHPYALPAFIVFDWADVSPDYEAWLLRETDDAVGK